MDSAVPSGKFWHQVLAQTQYALKTGALQSIETDYEWIEQDGIAFLVRISTNLSRKVEARSSAPQPRFNPFLPYDLDLFVANLSDTHLCLLNKYNVTQHHLLIVTRAFEPQETLLNLPDFEALWYCMQEIGKQTDSLGFYNSGELAGASQPHRHLQLVPLPITPALTSDSINRSACDSGHLPIQVALDQAARSAQPEYSPMLPFRHAVGWLSAATSAAEVYAAYLQALSQLGLNCPEPPPYNLLVTRRWLLVVPRRQAEFEAIPVNALGFAGSLFVRSQVQLEQLRQLGPLSLLSQVAAPVNSVSS